MENHTKYGCLNMKQTSIFKTYNQITKLFDVMIMTKQQINKLDTNQGFLVVTPKKHIDVVRPRKPRNNSKAPKWFEDFIINQFEPLSNKLDSVIKLNNLKTRKI